MAQFVVATCPSHDRNIKLFLRCREETHPSAVKKFAISPFPNFFTSYQQPAFSWLSTGEEDGYLHWQYHRCHSEGHGCGIWRFFQLCGSFCLSVHHHPVGQQGFPNSPGSAVQQPCRQVLRYVVCTPKCLGAQSKSFPAQKCCII